MGLFDFLVDQRDEPMTPRGVVRLNQRHRLLIEPYRDEITGARVLDIAAHDGRWSYALAEAGAREVVGIEARQNLIDQFEDYPDAPWKQNVHLRCGDVFDVLENLAEEGEEFDLVAVYGFFYHTIEHFRLLRLIDQLSPQAIFIDGDFSQRPMALIETVFERTDLKVNAAPQVPGQEKAIIGVPSIKATNFMARALGYGAVWADAQEIFGDTRDGVHDYFQKDGRRRMFCTLLPTL